MSIIKTEHIDKFYNKIKLHDFICHFYRQEFGKIYLRFGKIYKITKCFIYYKDKKGIERKCLYYNCVKISKNAYYNLNDQSL